MRGFLEAVRAGCPRLRALVTSTHDKFVIFSDFHMTDRMSRQDWFFRFNFKPYLEVLTRYSQDGCELIENGDVEDLGPGVAIPGGRPDLAGQRHSKGSMIKIWALCGLRLS